MSDTAINTANINAAATTREIPLSHVMWLEGANNARVDGIRDMKDAGFRTLVQSMAISGWLKNEGSITVIPIENAAAIGLDTEKTYSPEGISIVIPDENGKLIKHDVSDNSINDTLEVLYAAGEVKYIAIDGYHRYTGWILANSYRENVIEIPNIMVQPVMVDDIEEFYRLQMSDNRRAAFVATSLWEILNDCLPSIEAGGGEVSLYTGKAGELPPCKNKGMASGMYAMALCYLKIKMIGDNPAEMVPFDAIEAAKKSGWLPDQRFRNTLNKYLKETLGVPDRLKDAFLDQHVKNAVAEFIKKGPSAPAPAACWNPAFDAATSDILIDQLKKYCKGGELDNAVKTLLKIDTALTAARAAGLSVD